jgi:tRNA pseudouridine13 synthase
MTLGDPLPRQYLTNDPGIGGTIKARPEDFLVDELPLYEPCGEGEHIYLGVETTGVPHVEMISVIRRCMGVRERAVGFAGMKDKHAVTRQMVSVHKLDEPSSYETGHDRVKILWAKRHRNRLRRGHLVGNRFSIRIRDVDPMKAPQVLRTLQRLERIGVPAYFGPQRFGYRLNNHRLGACLLTQNYRVLLDDLLGATGSPFPEYQRPRRELFDQGRYAEALAMWTAADRSERLVLRALAAGDSEKHACFAPGPTTCAFWISSLQSAIFNRLLDQRLQRGELDVLKEGDLAWKHDSRAVFAVTAEELATGELPPRLANLEISPSGPLWGKDMTRASGEVDAAEVAAVAELGLSVEQMIDSPRSGEGRRRPLREVLRHPELDAGVDEHGQFIRVAFDLPRGMYATVVLREIMKEQDSGDRSLVSEGETVSG